MAILADDLIWATRLADLVQGAGAVPVPVRSLAALETALTGVVTARDVFHHLAEILS